MMEFFDTSVLVAAFRGGHANHDVSLKCFAAAEKKHAACAVHSLAEVYAVMTSLAVKPLIPPEQALLFVGEVWARLTPISLTAEEYMSALQRAASRGVSGGRIYDSLLLAAATKCNARVIYTWNLKHFQSIAPDLAERIQTP